MPKLHVTLYDTRTFFQKAGVATGALFLLQPMIYFHLYFPSVIYLSGLIVLHFVFLYLYVARIPWRQLFVDKRSLAARLVGIALMIYILTLCNSRVNLRVLFINTIAAATLHAAILFLLMVKELALVSETIEP